MSSQEDENDNEEIENGHISQSSGSHNSEEESSDDETVNANSGQFDTDLPVAHRYLGKLKNTSKYTVYDDGEEIEIMAIHTRTLVFPGFTLPLLMNNHYENNVIQTYLQKSKSIALITTRQNYIFSHGTILEVVESQTKSGSLSIKARGRQRCVLVPGKEIRNLAGRLQMITVRALGEHPITSPLIGTQLYSLKARKPYTSPDYEDLKKLAKYRKYHIAQYPFPEFIYNNYEVCLYVKKLLDGLSNYIREYLPTDPVQLSYWFPQNYQLDHDERLNFLRIDSALERLKLAVKLINLNRLICCENCGVEITDHKKVFAMSKDGIQNNYVNPGGHVYETVTVTEAKNFTLVGSSSKQFSWFPGYAWTIMQCKNCTKHLGWKFSSSRLKPNVFYGLANSGFKIVTHEDLNTNMDFDLLDLVMVHHSRFTYAPDYYF